MMKSKKVRVVSCSLAAALSLGAASAMLAACGGKSAADNETTPLTMASDLFDGVFNPFFYTSGPDGEVVAQTQIGMLSSDENGQPVAGDDEPCVAKAFSVVTTGSKDTMGDTGTSADYDTYHTDYYFAIKNDITFSDGTPLTINDVLFNIYMYLDPAYTGSSTMYSVDIQGLVNYRSQDPSEDASEDAFSQEISDRVERRIADIENWADTSHLTTPADPSVVNGDGALSADVDKICEYFREELNSAWVSAMNADMKEYEKYPFTENWEVFLWNYGVITTTPVRENHQVVRYEIDRQYDENIPKTQESLVEYVYQKFLAGRSSASTSFRTNLVSIINNYSTANSFRSYLSGDETRKYVEEMTGGGELPVPNVKGVMAERGSTIPAAGGGTIDLGEELDILHIRINGEDPKAIQNFSFTVAPLHYYSPLADEFSIENNNFGVSWSDPDFMNQIRAFQVPLGAGPYRATTSNGSAATDTIDKSAFYNNNIVYFERNDSFLLGAPKIKFLRYQVISQSLLYDAIETGTVHYGSPTASRETMEKLNNEDADTLDYKITENLGYGYIGINARFVDNLLIRKAIMYALDPQLALDYYQNSQLASIIYRPMSTTLKDYYPTGAEAYYPYDKTGDTSLRLAQMAGYAVASGGPNDGLLVNSQGETLSFTFTIAGDTADHPAYATMEKAAQILNDKGFDITVTTDSTALSKLASGQLEVWAAAWSSSSDPDMYQVYHKDSTATSILNWGFPTIEETGTAEEIAILEELAAKIEEGRETTVVSERRRIYSESDAGASKLSDTGSGDVSALCALDLVMELAVEFPLYQRSALFVFREGLFDEASYALFDQSTAFQSPLSKIWLIGYAQ